MPPSPPTILASLLRLPAGVALLIYQSIVLALAQIRSNKVRSMLTTVGIVIGVASVTAVIAALTGLKAKVLKEFEAIGTNKMFVFPYRNDPKGVKKSWRTYRFLTEQFDGFLEHCPDIAGFTRVYRDSKTVANGVHSEDAVDVTGIDPDWHQIENRSVIMGRPFTLIDNEQARPVCLINEKVRDKLALDRDCTGQDLMIGGRRFRIVGLVESKTEATMFGQGQSGLEVLVPFKTVYQRDRGGFMVMAASRSPEVAEEARAEADFFLRKKRRMAVGQPANFRIEAVQKYLDQFNTLAVTITMVAGGVVGISLLVGGVGIMNIMLVSVSERTREIGLRKAVGARPSAILLQFLVEAVMLCCLGGAVGVGLGQLLTTAIAHIPGANLERAFIPGWAVAVSFGFAAGVGLIFGMFPALKAARLDPIDALRHE